MTKQNCRVERDRARAEVVQELEKLLERDGAGTFKRDLLQHDIHLVGCHVFAQLEQHGLRVCDRDGRARVRVVLLEHALELHDLLGRELLQERGRQHVTHGGRVLSLIPLSLVYVGGARLTPSRLKLPSSAAFLLPRAPSTDECASAFRADLPPKTIIPARASTCVPFGPVHFPMGSGQGGRNAAE